MAIEKGTTWLKHLFGRRAEASAEDLPVQETPVQAAPPPVPLWLTVDDGALLQVWKRWKGENVPPPELPLFQDEECPLPVDKHALMRERVRLKTMLEKDAKARLQTINEWEKTGVGPLDASCKAYLSQSALLAWLFIFPPFGEGGRMQMEEVGKALQLSGVTSGIDSAAVVQLVQETPYFQLIPIACGTMPVEGHDGSVIEHYPRKLAMEIKVDEQGVADYRSVSYVQLIRAGDVICDIIPPEEGQPGIRVDGKVVEPKKVHPAKVPSGRNTALTEDGAHLVATLDGHLVFSGNAFNVRPLLDIPGNVDYETGNVDYHGDVHIHGDVRENFFVRATGTVTVDGTVEAANVEAGGDLIVSSGVLGDNRAVIKSGGCIRVKYLESCVAYAAKGVYADCIISAHVYSDDCISVTTGRGTIIGGSMTAARLIKAKTIGSQAGMKTNLFLGTQPYAEEQRRTDEEELEKIYQEMEELSKTMDYLEEKQLFGSTDLDETLAKARLRKSVLYMKASQLMDRQDAREAAEPDLSKCRLECDIVYPVTNLKIESDLWRADSVKHRCRVVYDQETNCVKEL